MIDAAFAGSWTPASSITIWFEPALEIEAERDLLVHRRPGNAKRNHSRQSGENEPDKDQVRTAVRQRRRVRSLAFATLVLGWRLRLVLLLHERCDRAPVEANHDFGRDLELQ